VLIPLVASSAGSAATGLVDALALPLRILRGLRAIPPALTRIAASTDAVEDLHSELRLLRADLAGMPGDTRRLADDVETVHEVLRVLRRELVEIKSDVEPVHDDLGRVEAGLAPLPDKLDALLPKIDDLAGRLDGMRGELAGELDALRTDLSGLPFVSKT
jgi:chromosome segregation ATPase